MHGAMSVDDTNSPCESKNAIDRGMTVWNIQNCSWVSTVEGEEHPGLAREVGHPHEALLPRLRVAASHRQNVAGSRRSHHGSSR